MVVQSVRVRIVLSTQQQNVAPLTGLTNLKTSGPGRRFAAIAASLCPGLVCVGLSGQIPTPVADAGKIFVFESYKPRRDIRRFSRSHQNVTRSVVLNIGYYMGIRKLLP